MRDDLVLHHGMHMVMAAAGACVWALVSAYLWQPAIGFTYVMAPIAVVHLVLMARASQVQS